MAFILFSIILFSTYCWAAADTSEWNHRCHPNTCKPPDCLCASQVPPNDLEFKKVPQLVMMTFDGAVTDANMVTYRELILRSGRKNKNGCPIRATFFVSHEYTNYRLVHILYRRGNEIAVHSISHKPLVEMWKNLTYEEWSEEIVGMRTMLSTFGRIPQEKILGVRAPFLQIGGDVFFTILSDNKFLYDSSIPTLQRSDPPLWPYTLGKGFQHDCQIQPCPEHSYNGFWLIPLVNWFGLPQIDKKTGREFEQPCAMVDGCTPETKTFDDTLKYLKKNFERHYHSISRAPFPIFLREGWLQNYQRKEAFFRFVDELLEMDDVVFVTIQEAIEYLRNPVESKDYKQNCPSIPNRCPSPGYDCSYELDTVEGKTERRMGSCVRCPGEYPWVGNPTGKS